MFEASNKTYLFPVSSICQNTSDSWETEKVEDFLLPFSYSATSLCSWICCFMFLTLI